MSRKLAKGGATTGSSKPMVYRVRKQLVEEGFEECEHPRLKLHAHLKRKADQHNQCRHAVPYENALGAVWEQEKFFHALSPLGGRKERKRRECPGHKRVSASFD